MCSGIWVLSVSNNPKIVNEQMSKQCFGEYCAFTSDCDRCYELSQYCKMWKHNMFNFRRRRNLTMFICFIIIVAWNIKIGFDLLKTEFRLLSILDLLAILLLFLSFGTNIRSGKLAMKAYQAHLRINIKNQMKTQSERTINEEKLS